MHRAAHHGSAYVSLVTFPGMQAQCDGDQGTPEATDRHPTVERPRKACARRTDRTAKKHTPHEYGVETVPRFWTKCEDDVLVRYQCTLFAKIQQNDSGNQAGNLSPCFENDPRHDHDGASQPDHGMGSSAISDFSRDGSKKHPDGAHDAEQSSDLGTEMVLRVKMQRENGPQGAE
jgi:hypothetical protein